MQTPRKIVQHHVILASTSLARREILRMDCSDFSVVDPGTDESVITDPDPRRMAVLRAVMKSADATAKLETGLSRLVLAFDQVAVVNDQEVRGKPKDRAQLLEWLRGYAYSTVSFVNAVVVVPVGATEKSDHDAVYRSVVTVNLAFGPIPERDILAAADHPRSLQCASGVAMECRELLQNATLLFRKATGTDGTREDAMDAIRGFPRSATWRLLREADSFATRFLDGLAYADPETVDSDLP